MRLSGVTKKHFTLTYGVQCKYEFAAIVRIDPEKGKRQIFTDMLQSREKSGGGFPAAPEFASDLWTQEIDSVSIAMRRRLESI